MCVARCCSADMGFHTDQLWQDPNGLKPRLPLYPPPCMLGSPVHVGGTELSPGAPQKFPCSKLKLDSLFLQWLAMPESQKLVRLPCLGWEKWLEHGSSCLGASAPKAEQQQEASASLHHGEGQSRGIKAPKAILHWKSWQLELVTAGATVCRSCALSCPWSCPVSVSALSPFTCQLAAAAPPRCAAIL